MNTKNKQNNIIIYNYQTNDEIIWKYLNDNNYLSSDNDTFAWQSYWRHFRPNLIYSADWKIVYNFMLCRLVILNQFGDTFAIFEDNLHILNYKKNLGDHFHTVFTIQTG